MTPPAPLWGALRPAFAWAVQVLDLPGKDTVSDHEYVVKERSRVQDCVLARRALRHPQGPRLREVRQDFEPGGQPHPCTAPTLRPACCLGFRGRFWCSALNPATPPDHPPGLSNQPAPRHCGGLQRVHRRAGRVPAGLRAGAGQPQRKRQSGAAPPDAVLCQVLGEGEARHVVGPGSQLPYCGRRAAHHTPPPQELEASSLPYPVLLSVMRESLVEAKVLSLRSGLVLRFGHLSHIPLNPIRVIGNPTINNPPPQEMKLIEQADKWLLLPEDLLRKASGKGSARRVRAERDGA